MADRGSNGGDSQDLQSSLMELRRYDPSSLPSENSQTSQSGLSSSELPNENPEVEEFQLADRNDPILCQLEELLSSNLNAIFRSAIKRIAAFGYNEDVAEKGAISRGGLYFGSKDPVSNIVDDTLSFLTKGRRIAAFIETMYLGSYGTWW